MKKSRRYGGSALVAVSISVMTAIGATPAVAGNHVPNKPPMKMKVSGQTAAGQGDKSRCGGGCAQIGAGERSDQTSSSVSGGAVDKYK
ncbi:hypothetical protein ACH4FX_39955 [Streptomyces sp. NPDC018019]|uniref:hypothetical protein n=1 Tax=Streptomyces sp. NPDC018019 TaxID=3365030 RepID=UPI00379DCCA8